MTGSEVDGTAAVLVVSNDQSELARVAAWVHAWTERHCLPARTAQCLDLCSAEVITNVMKHAYPDRAPHQICLRLERRGDRVALEIEDDGGEFDPRHADEREPATTLEDASVGGWGIRIVRRLSDELLYHRSEGRNHVTLIFRPTSSSP